MNSEQDGWLIESVKFDGSAHRIWTEAFPLQPSPLYKGEALPHFMLLVPAYTKVVEKDGRSWESPFPVIACFYALKHYQVMILCKQPSFQYYCNSCSIPEIDPVKRKVRFIDLDLDLLVDEGRSARIVDRDEFAVHRLQFGYPDELCGRVESDLDELTKQVRQQRGVFSPHFVIPG